MYRRCNARVSCKRSLPRSHLCHSRPKPTKYGSAISISRERCRSRGGVTYSTSFVHRPPWRKLHLAPVPSERVGEAAEGVFLTQAAFDPDSEEPETKAFVEAYRAKYQSEPNLYAVHGYDATLVLAEALRRSGNEPSHFWSAVRSLRDFTGAAGTIQFDERGDVQKFPRVYVVHNGELMDYEAEVERRRQKLLDDLRKLEEEQRRTRAETGG